MWGLRILVAQETLLALSCSDLDPRSVCAGEPLLAALLHPPGGHGMDGLRCEVRLCPREKRMTRDRVTCPLVRI